MKKTKFEIDEEKIAVIDAKNAVEDIKSSGSMQWAAIIQYQDNAREIYIETFNDEMRKHEIRLSCHNPVSFGVC